MSRALGLIRVEEGIRGLGYRVLILGYGGFRI